MRAKLNHRNLFLGSLVAIIILATTAGTTVIYAEAGSPGGVSVQKFTNEGSFSTEYIITKVNEAGYANVFSIELEHGLYDIKVRDKHGQLVEVYMDLKKGELLKDPKTGKIRYKIVSRAAFGQTHVPWGDIVAEVKAEGYVEVYSIMYEHAMYEVQARDAQNRRFELFINPNTGKLLRDPKSGKALAERLDIVPGKAPQ